MPTAHGLHGVFEWASGGLTSGLLASLLAIITLTLFSFSPLGGGGVGTTVGIVPDCVGGATTGVGDRDMGDCGIELSDWSANNFRFLAGREQFEYFLAISSSAISGL